MEFHEKLIAAAAKRHLTKMEVVRISGLAQSSVYQWFSNKSKPGIEAALILARTLNVSLDYLLGDSVGGPVPDPLVPPLTAEETQMVEEIRRMGHEFAWRRLHRLPDPPG